MACDDYTYQQVKKINSNAEKTMTDPEVKETILKLIKMGKEDFLFYSKIILQLWQDKKEVCFNVHKGNFLGMIFKTAFIPFSTLKMLPKKKSTSNPKRSSNVFKMRRANSLQITTKS